MRWAWSLAFVLFLMMSKPFPSEKEALLWAEKLPDVTQSTVRILPWTDQWGGAFYFVTYTIGGSPCTTAGIDRDFPE